MSAKDRPNSAPGVPMMFPPWLERLQVKYMNPAMKPLARYVPGASVIKHRGRKSGKPYETIVTAYRKGNVLAIVLGHGKTDWVKNVLAASMPAEWMNRKVRVRCGRCRTVNVAVEEEGVDYTKGFGRRPT